MNTFQKDWKGCLHLQNPKITFDYKKIAVCSNDLILPRNNRGRAKVLNLRNTSGLTLFGMKFTPATAFSEKCKINTLGTFSNFVKFFAHPCMYVVGQLIPFYKINRNCPYFVELARKPSEGNRVNPCSNYLENASFVPKMFGNTLIRHCSQVHQDVELPAIDEL